MQIPDAEALCRELAAQIRPHVTPDTALVGIRTGGLWLAERLHAELGLATPLGAIDVSFYRDDYAAKGLHANPQRTDIPCRVEGAPIVLVDDVLYTGRTVRAALDVIMDWGRPRAIRLAVLIDRGHRELPIRPDYVGKNLPTRRDEMVNVSRDGVQLGEMRRA